eukprot:9480474-Pyramimonas_sp.AAC.1
MPAPTSSTTAPMEARASSSLHATSARQYLAVTLPRAGWAHRNCRPWASAAHHALRARGPVDLHLVANVEAAFP